jgi:hypothetical protein
MHETLSAQFPDLGLLNPDAENFKQRKKPRPFNKSKPDELS